MLIVQEDERAAHSAGRRDRRPATATAGRHQWRRRQDRLLRHRKGRRAQFASLSDGTHAQNSFGFWHDPDDLADATKLVRNLGVNCRASKSVGYLIDISAIAVIPYS
jgi:hypothetical protein